MATGGKQPPKQYVQILLQTEQQQSVLRVGRQLQTAHREHHSGKSIVDGVKTLPSISGCLLHH